MTGVQAGDPPPTPISMLLAPQRSLEETFPARPESIPVVRSAVAGFAAQEGASHRQLEQIRLAVSEAATNVVRHAYRTRPGTLRITATAVDRELWVLVTDTGCGHQTPAADPGLGWGLALIAQACDQFVLMERSEGGTEARMCFLLGPEAA